MALCLNQLEESAFEVIRCDRSPYDEWQMECDRSNAETFGFEEQVS